MCICRKVNELDYTTGEIIHTFKSIQEAIDMHDIDRNSIYNAINKRGGYMPYKKLRFSYAGPYATRKVRQLDYETGEFIEEYNSAESAADDNFIAPTTLRKALKFEKGHIHSKRLRFEYAD